MLTSAIVRETGFPDNLSRSPGVTFPACGFPEQEEVLLIRITRNLARQLGAVLRKSVLLHSVQKPCPLALRTTDEGLRIQAHSPTVAIEYCLPGRHEPEMLILPADALADCEGRDDSPVEFSINT